MASNQEIRRRSSAADRHPMTPAVAAAAAASMTTTLAPAPDFTSRNAEDASTTFANKQNIDAAAMPPPPTPQQVNGQESQATSPNTRNANRLSLTLPIALPTSDPSRPMPKSTSSSSIPATPVDSSVANPLGDTNNFIIAIAAQERRVLELKEELTRAEAELTSLKRQWSVQEAYGKKTQARFAATESPRRNIPGTEDEQSAQRQGADHDRRKLLLQTQNQTPPNQKGRRVYRGGHARTLSLLSPAKPTENGFNVHEDRWPEPIGLGLPPVEKRTAQLLNPNLAKRASWQPQSFSQQNQAAMPQFVEDFRLGLKAFVEDIRQITVGDEPINGNLPSSRSAAANPRAGGLTRTMSATDQETIRPSQGARPKVTSIFDSPSSTTSSPTPSGKSKDATREKAKPGKSSKHFSWTPLSFDSLDDEDWASWESPASVKSARWSGSTVNGAGAEDIQSIPEAGEESEETTSKAKSSVVGNPLLSPKLEEIIPNMVDKLRPVNLKRTATNLMDEWEKSLTPPGSSHNKENSM